MALAWATDTHLDLAKPEAVRAFNDEIVASGAGAVVVTGDVAHSWSIERALGELVREIDRPIYFVLGNHDFYSQDASVPAADTRAAIARMCAREPRLVYLSAIDHVELAPGVALVGHDGWADGRAGVWATSRMRILDHELIADLAGVRHDRDELLRRVQALADLSIAHLRRVLPPVLARYPRVLVATHAPPFRAATWHLGAPSDDNAAPHFCNHILGELLAELAAAHPERELLVLCGHTHSPGEVRVLPNLTVWTGGARYGQPRLVRTIDV